MMEEGNDIFTPRGLEEALVRHDVRERLRKKNKERKEKVKAKPNESANKE